MNNGCGRPPAVARARYAPSILPTTLQLLIIFNPSLLARPLARFASQESGLTRTPSKLAPGGGGGGAASDSPGPSLNMRASLVRVDQLGRGASGTVYRAVHLLSMRVVAVKEIPVFDQDKRRQMVMELKALYANLSPLSGACAACDL